MLPLLQLIICIPLLLFATPAQCAEIDSVTPRRVALEDSMSALNSIINGRIREGVDSANERLPRFGQLEKEDYCDEEKLFKELRKAIFGSLTASWGLKGYGLDKQLRELLAEKSYSLSLNDSVYRDINYIEGFSLNLKELSDVVNINGHLIGLDKIGHFFAEGWKYFEITHLEGKTIQQAIQWGREEEEGKFGYATTGIFSYADLAANFNGWRFWNRVLRGGDDPLQGILANFFTSSYIGCKFQFIDSILLRKWVHAWKVKKQFDLNDFINGAWDEGNNCNSYKNPKIEEKVMSRVKSIDSSFNCPVSPEECRMAVGRYGDYAKLILHPTCLREGM